MTETKAKMYNTAVALISCAYFGAGMYVTIKYEFTAANGVKWFLCNDKVMYPEHHLTRFLL